MKEKKVVFKRYVQEQMMLLPPSYEEMVPRNHPVRVVNEVIERIEIGGGARPDHNTINDFRGKRLKEHLKKIFNQVVVLMAEQGVLNLRELTLDGTKIEANANRYTFVWGKSIKVSRERIARQLLTSEEGIERRKQRWKVEAVFGNIKHNKGFKRFFLRGLEKVNTELGLIAIAHNLQRFSQPPAI